MLYKDTVENHIARNEKKIREIEIENEQLQRLEGELFSDLNVTPKQIHTFLADQEQFSLKNLLHIEEQREDLEKKINRSIANVSNVLETKKSIDQRKEIGKHGQHWLFVK
ncbi:hypothetical protein BN1013_00064 [Candidatus Rubidus massiliensis]|nr:MAG: hypothetical protein BGO10_07290 [Chlamydia sp. 32-24]CDZ79570.1 hypothetical protein BN1013_00064 [Candidatus Rubidus massiliensis]